MTDHLKKQVVEEELEKLLQEEYISKAVYEQIIKAQYQYYEDFYRTVSDMAAADLLGEIDRELPERLTQSKVTSSITNEAIAVPTNEAKSEEQEEQKPVIAKSRQLEKKKKTNQEIRERNITWLLGIGVVFLLIAGTFLATSTWYLLPDVVKTLLIALVAGLFIGLALLTDKVLKISKTGLAFYVLGALFLPIIILSIGFYGQLGQYLSIEGDGKYLLGALGAMVLLPVYMNMAKKLQSRLFVWFAYVCLTFLAGFFIGWLDLPIDGFYLGMVLFNTALIILYRYSSKLTKWSFYLQDFMKYLQANLILTSALLILFYENAMMNGFNLVITAGLYLAMVYVTNYRNYHYVFTLLFVYGAYQMIEFSMLQEVDAILYALLGFVFLFLPKILKGSHDLSKVFQYTSAIISGLAFIFISMKAMVLTTGEPSIVLVIAYLLIAFNFLYLTNSFQIYSLLFGYISIVFLMIGLYELVLVGQEVLGYAQIELPLLCMAFFLYGLLGCFMQHPFFKKVKQSSRDIGAFVMVIITIISMYTISSWQLGVMFILLSMSAVLMFYYEKRLPKYIPAISTWIHPILFGFAMMSFYFEVSKYITIDVTYLPPTAVIAGVLGLVISGFWRQRKAKAFYHHSFYVAQLFYYYGMIQTLDVIIYANDPLTRVAVYFGGIIMAYLLYRKTKWTFTPYLISTISLLFYLVVLYAGHQLFDLTMLLFVACQFTIASIIFFIIGFMMQKKHPNFTHAFWWIAHLFLPLALLMELFTTDEIGFWPILITGIIYGISLFRAKKNWLIHYFLYAALTSISLTVTYFMLLIHMKEHVIYSFSITILIFMMMWFTVSNAWKERLKFYIVPYAILTMMLHLPTVAEDPWLFGITVALAAFINWFLIRLRWDIYTILPLALLLIAILAFGLPNKGFTYGMLLAYAVALFTVGMLLFKSLYQLKEKELPSIDWFSVIGLITLCILHGVASDQIIDQLLPDILIVIVLLMQRNRITPSISKWVMFVATLYAFKPYYELLAYLHIPDVIQTELYVLPWIAVVSLLKKVTDKQHKVIMNYIQWAVLIIIAFILVQDALNSGTIYDALILGTLALVSMLVGMNIRLKSFFFVGLIVLLLNFLLQTKPFWGNLPWWMYLLIAGALLIIVASYNEWSKQKKADGKESFIKRWYQKTISSLKEWD